MSGPDQKASIETNVFKTMAEFIRNIEKAISGSGIKVPSVSEKNIVVTRKSIVSKCSIWPGDIFSENLTVERPSSGICPMKWNEVIEKTAQRVFVENELIEL